MKNIVEAVEKNVYECMDWMENIIKDLLEKYENQEAYTDCEEYRREGAICALEELLDIIGGN